MVHQAKASSWVGLIAAEKRRLARSTLLTDAPRANDQNLGRPDLCHRIFSLRMLGAGVHGWRAAHLKPAVPSLGYGHSLTKTASYTLARSMTSRHTTRLSCGPGQPVECVTASVLAALTRKRLCEAGCQGRQMRHHTPRA